VVGAQIGTSAEHKSSSGAKLGQRGGAGKSWRGVEGREDQWELSLGPAQKVVLAGLHSLQPWPAALACSQAGRRGGRAQRGGTGAMP